MDQETKDALKEIEKHLKALVNLQAIALGEQEASRRRQMAEPGIVKKYIKEYATRAYKD